MKKRSSQLKLIKAGPSSYGGELLKTRKGRSGGRPLDTKSTMHLMLRSTKAVGEWSFRKPKNAAQISKIVDRFAKKYGVKVISLANVGNHLHFHIKLANRFTYKPFIRAITSSIAMAVTGASRWKPFKSAVKEKGIKTSPTQKLHFWDYRPFSRVVQSFRANLNLRDYIHINQLEGFGLDRVEAKMMLIDQRERPWRYSSG